MRVCLIQTELVELVAVASNKDDNAKPPDWAGMYKASGELMGEQPKYRQVLGSHALQWDSKLSRWTVVSRQSPGSLGI